MITFNAKYNLELAQIRDKTHTRSMKTQIQRPIDSHVLYKARGILYWFLAVLREHNSQCRSVRFGHLLRKLAVDRNKDFYKED